MMRRRWAGRNPERGEHTPGPWKIIKGEKMVELVKDTPEGDCILTAKLDPWNSFNHNTNEANARLIAASPELFEACSWASQAYHHPTCEFPRGHPKKCTCYVGACKQAIAKAREDSPGNIARRNPGEIEFFPQDTGGNCTALYGEHGGFHILVTDYDDPVVPVEGRRFVVGLYDLNDEYLFSREFPDFDLFALEGRVKEAIGSYRRGDPGRRLEDMR